MKKTYFQDLQINWSKASKEYIYDNFISKEKLENSDYLYKEQMNDLLSWLEIYINQTPTNTNINNIFSIIGGRGTGKSSFIRSATKIIDEKKFTDVSSITNNQSIYKLDPIDPTVFTSSLNILELFIATLKSKIDNTNGKSKDNDHFKKITKFNKTVTDIIEVLKNIRINKSSFAEKSSGIEVLDNIQNQQSFFSKISELIESFLTIINKDRGNDYKYLCLSIDDLDLVPNQFTHETLQLIIKFLKNQTNLILLIAYRKEQLVDSVLANLLLENKELLDRKEIDTTELRDQAVNFIDKGLPLPQQVVLEFKLQTRISDILSPFIEPYNNESETIFSGFLNSDNEPLTIRQFIQKSIMEQTRIQIEPIESLEQTQYTNPRNLRAAIQFLEFIHKLANYQISINSNDDRLKSLGLLSLNLNRYRQYLLNGFRENLSKDNFEIILDWRSQDYQARNRSLCNNMLNSIQSASPNSLNDYYINILNKQPYNVSLGDVFAVLDLYTRENKHSDAKLFFIYALKMLYSIELLSLLVHSLIDRTDNLHLEGYFSLTKGKIIPDGYYYNDSFTSGNAQILLAQTIKDLYEPINAPLNKLLYSSLSASGNIRVQGKQSLDDFGRGFSYQFREFYANYEFVKGNHYLIDPFAQLSSQFYVQHKLDLALKENQNNYLFYSMFDLDFFIRKNYSRRSSTGRPAIIYSLKRVNDCFTGSLSTANEIDMRTKMVMPLFEADTSKEFYKYNPIFTENEIATLANEIVPPESISSIKDLSLEEIDTLIALGNDSLKYDYVKPKREFAKQYFQKMSEWPKNMHPEQKERMDNFISKPRSQGFDELNDNLKLMTETLNGHRSNLLSNNLIDSEKTHD
ncbi:hypothetical protein [uncultured Vagococcus sp.]|uniref:hypothetical protein n=1 Tax=uncultured Vagococcus sp. TaxID=189676 RepID=UPI0028D52141|nr:hypothetical protein [uncultured Vagococcus sp.]